MTPWVAVAVLLLGSGAAAQEHSLSLAGPEELVYSGMEMNCGGHERGSRRDRIDMPITAFRRQDGSVVVLSGNKNNFYMEGASVEAAKRVCENLVEPVNDPDPATFTNHRWLFAIHAKSHDSVLGFVHNEYHGADFLDDCELTDGRNRECWYGSTGLVVSHDGGFTFETPPLPDNVLAALPYRFRPGMQRAGTPSPKVVGNPHDGRVYVMIHFMDRNEGRSARGCILRGSGTAFNDWLAWDGDGFDLHMESPYVVERSDAGCTPVVPFIVHSLKYVPAIDQFVALGVDGRELRYAFSKDLVEWSPPATLMEFEQKQRWQPGRPAARSYFSLLDPDSSSINFDTLDKRPYLYFVQYGTSDKRTFRRERSVHRVPIAIQ